MPWVRSGSCCRCGQCCRGSPWAGPDEDRDAVAQGAPPRAAAVNGYCHLFEWRRGAPEGDGFCVGHEPPKQHLYYLKACQTWPTHPEQIKDKEQCSYRFEWME